MNDNKLYDEKLNSNDVKHPSNDKKKVGLPEVPLYTNMLSANRKNVKVDGFDFDVDTFENLIDNYTPMDNIITILSGICRKKLTQANLDDFCYIVYGMDFKETYKFLTGITDMYMRKVFKNLAVAGNTTAMSINAKFFMKLEDEQKNDTINIRIVNDLENK